MQLYPDMDLEWVLPLVHERKLQSTVIYEIFYERLLLFAFLSISMLFILTRGCFSLDSDHVIRDGHHPCFILHVISFIHHSLERGS